MQPNYSSRELSNTQKFKSSVSLQLKITEPKIQNTLNGDAKFHNQIVIRWQPKDLLDQHFRQLSIFTKWKWNDNTKRNWANQNNQLRVGLIIIINYVHWVNKQ